MVDEIVAEILSKPNLFYVYLLLHPDGTPFYVGKARSYADARYKNGKAKRQRIFQHEKDAKKGGSKDKKRNSIKENIIRSIWRANDKVGYRIDSWHMLEESSLDREIELIAEFGRICNGTGCLANMTDGGEDGKLSEESLKKLSQAKKELFANNPAMREEAATRIQIALKKWKEENPEEYEEARLRCIEATRTEEYRNRRSAQVKKKYEDDPSILEKMSESQKIRWANDPSLRDFQRENIFKWINENPSAFAEKCRKSAEYVRSAKSRKRQSKALKKWIKENPLLVEEAKRKANEVRATPEYRKRMSVVHKERHKRKIIAGEVKIPSYLTTVDKASGKSYRYAEMNYPPCLHKEHGIKHVHLGTAGSTRSIIRYYQHTYRIRILLRRLADKLRAEQLPSEPSQQHDP